jgi:hypothetical protein
MLREIKLPNGSIEEFEVPENWSDEQVASAAANYFKLSAPKQTSENPEKTQETPKRNAEDFWNEALRQNFGREQSIGGNPEIAKARETPLGQGLELGASLIAPPLRMAKLGVTLGRYLPNFGRYLTSAIENAVPQVGISAGSAALSNQNPLEAAGETAAITTPFSIASQMAISRNPAVNKIARYGLATALGGLGGYGGYKTGESFGISPTATSATVGALGFGLGIRGRPSARIPSEIGKEVEKYPEAIERIAASRRLGLPYITPLESTGSGRLGAMEGKLSVNPHPEAADILVNEGEKRVAAEGKAINDTLDLISNPEIVAKKREAYSKSYYTKEPNFLDSKKIPIEFKKKYGRKVPKDVFGLKDNEIFKAAENKLSSEPELKEALKGVPKNSVEYLDNIKKVMGDMAYEQNRGKFSKGLIEDTQRTLMEGLEKHAPTYKEANAFAERGFAREKIEDFFDKKRVEGVPMAQFLKSKEGFEELQKHLRNIPEAQQQLKDMKLVFTNLMPSLTGTGTAKLYGTGMKEARSGGQFYEKIMNNLLYSNDKIIANFITDPKWAEKLQEMKKITNKEKLTKAFIEMMGRAGAKSYVHKE